MFRKSDFWCPETQSYRGLPKKGIKELENQLAVLKNENTRRRKSKESYIDEFGKSVIQYDEDKVDECYTQVAAILSKFPDEITDRVIDALTALKAAAIVSEYTPEEDGVDYDDYGD